MTTLDFTDGSINGIEAVPEATPGDLNTVCVRKGFLNSAIQSVANGVICNVIMVNAGEVVLDVWARMITAESTANADCDLGFAGGAEVGGNLVTADSAANTMFYNANFTPYYFAAENAITIQPNNAVALDTGVIEVSAIIVKAFNKF